MTTTPHSVSADQSLKVAGELMKRHSIRHLPVMRNGRLTGILTDRDLKLANSLQGVDAEKTLVDAIATDDPYLVSPESPLDEVVAYMADHRIGSTLIVDNHKLVGIFTSTDALRVLGDTLHARH